MPYEQRVIKNKLGLLKPTRTLASVSEACKLFRFSRDSFYRFKELYDTGGEVLVLEAGRLAPPELFDQAADQIDCASTFVMVIREHRAKDTRRLRRSGWLPRCLETEQSCIVDLMLSCRDVR